jgi:hypothetical protein
MARRNEPPGNDNEDPDESWKRADLILQAYSGADLNNPEAQKTAISQLITDLMHYCDVMSITAKEGSPEHLDFEELLDTASEHFSVQKDTMDGAMEIGPQRLAAIGKLFRELSEGPKPSTPEPEKASQPDVPQQPPPTVPGPAATGKVLDLGYYSPERSGEREAASRQVSQSTPPKPPYEQFDDDTPRYYPDPPESWDQVNEQDLEMAEFNYHRGQWVEELRSIAEKSPNAAYFKTAIETDGNILARDSHGLIILGEQPLDGEVWRHRARFSAALTGKSDEEFKKFASAIDPAKVPSEEDARAILQRQQTDRDATRTVSANIIHDLTFTASDAKDFMIGLQEQAMILAREGEGKFAQFVVVDYEGEKYNLAHLVRPVRAPEFDAIMAAVDIQTLPTVALARAEQAQLHESVQNPSRTIDLSVYSPTGPAPEPAQQRAQAANDNLGKISDPRQRAEMTLEAYWKISGHTMRVDDAPASVITALLKDLMHYSKAKSEGQSNDSPVNVNIDRLSRVAEQEFEQEQKTPQEVAKELASFAPTLKLSELKEAAEDPQLEKLLNDLSARQSKEVLDLARKHELEVFGSPTSSQEERNEREFLEQAREFDIERERYIEEYKESKALLAELQEDEKLREQERGDSPDDDRELSR